MTQELSLGHWEYPGEIDPSDWFGFIYRIIDLDTDKEYIGKKQFWSVTRKEIKGKTRKKVIRKQSDWRKYTSSSKYVNAAILERGKERFLFLIETLCKSKSSLHYTEVETQINEDVLRAKLPSGERKFYNGMIANMKFITPDELPEETKMKISASLKLRWQNTDNHYFNLMTLEEKEKWNIKYRIGTNSGTKRGRTLEQIEKWIDENFRGENNSMFGRNGPLSPRWGATLSDDHRQNISDKMKGKFAGKNNPRYGKSPFENFSDEEFAVFKQRLSDRMSGEGNPMHGKPCHYKMTEEEKTAWKNKISETTKGKVKKESTKEKMKKAWEERVYEELTCPHCNTVGKGPNMARYHFDKCKSKPTA